MRKIREMREMENRNREMGNEIEEETTGGAIRKAPRFSPENGK